MSPLAIVNVLLSALMHAGWNMLVRHQRATDLFLQISVVITLLGLAPALLAELFGPPVLLSVWGNVLVAGTFLAIYYLSLLRGYQRGHFTVVYPLARGLPVLLLAFADIGRGNSPTTIGWLGIILVCGGSFLIPLESPRELRVALYWNRTTAWVLVAALATAGYSIADSAAAQVLAPGLATAIRYNVYESSFGLFAYAALLIAVRQPLRESIRKTNWRLPVLATIFVFGGYSLVLWAFQLSSHASYVIGLRQLSIVIGVIAGALLFREPAAGLRITAALIITLGVICISLAR